jgi:hypothetical protein
VHLLRVGFAVGFDAVGCAPRIQLIHVKRTEWDRTYHKKVFRTMLMASVCACSFTLYSLKELRSTSHRIFIQFTQTFCLNWEIERFLFGLVDGPVAASLYLLVTVSSSWRVAPQELIMVSSFRRISTALAPCLFEAAADMSFAALLK